MPKLKLEIQEIIVLYESGYSTTQIGEIAGVSSRYIRQLLTDKGVEKRPIGSWKRKYAFNEDYFKYWNNDMAYLLGFFIADGYIASQSQSVAFTQKILSYLKKSKSSSVQINHCIEINTLECTVCFSIAKLWKMIFNKRLFWRWWPYKLQRLHRKLYRWIHSIYGIIASIAT